MRRETVRITRIFTRLQSFHSAGISNSTFLAFGLQSDFECHNSCSPYNKLGKRLALAFSSQRVLPATSKLSSPVVCLVSIAFQGFGVLILAGTLSCVGGAVSSLSDIMFFFKAIPLLTPCYKTDVNYQK